MKRKAKKVDSRDAAYMKSSLCTLSKEPLVKPICICKLGNLYNKEEIVKRLIEKSMPKEGFSHIKKMKDVKEIRFDEGDSSLAKKETASVPKDVRILCPLT